jgi:tRNA 2-thiocytidine biosynthesis protein TtcA
LKKTKKLSKATQREQLGFSLSKKVGRAIADYGMLQDGDRIAVGVSGGEDSLTLLKILDERRSFVPIKYELIALHVDQGYHCIHPKVLQEYLKKNGHRYEIVKSDLLKPGQSRKDIDCFWCSWNRRKAMFDAAARLGCNKVALGHHLDDIIQTILLNLFFNGEISAMAPKQELFEGKLNIIRPLAYIEKKEISEFAKGLGMTHPRCKCPNADMTNRHAMEKLIAELSRVCPGVKQNIFRSVKRIKKDYLL